MINRDCKHMTADDKLTVKEMLIVGLEFVCAMACVPCFIVLSGLIVTMVK